MTVQVEIYTTPYCGYCRMAKQLLARKNVTYTEIDVSGDAALRQTMVERAKAAPPCRRSSSAAPMSAAATTFMSSNDAGKLDKLLAGQAVTQ